MAISECASSRVESSRAPRIDGTILYSSTHMAYSPSHKQAFSSFQSHPTGMHVTRAREAPPVAANGNQHLLCNGRCRHRCHKPAQGAWEPRLDTLEPLGSHGRWHGNWSDGRHGEGLANEWCPAKSNASAAQLLWFDLQALRSCLRNRHLLFVGDSSMRIFFSALISMVNGTLEWDTPDASISSWRLPMEPYARRATTCDYKRDAVLDVELPCFREYAAHGVRLSYVWKTFASDKPVSGRVSSGRAPTRSFSSELVRSLMSQSSPPDLVAIESGVWDTDARYAQQLSQDSQPSLAQQLADWIKDLRIGPAPWFNGSFVRTFVGYDGPLIFVQPVDSGPDFDRVIRGLGIPVLWRRPSAERPPRGFPHHVRKTPIRHACDVLAIEHANILLSSLCV